MQLKAIKSKFSKQLYRSCGVTATSKTLVNPVTDVLPHGQHPTLLYL